MFHLDVSAPTHGRSGSARGDYRPALDGVRAVAVLAVISFHVTTSKPRGGFLGVDIFFVLSGYLITTLLIRELNASGRVRVAAFWARRARRLLAALLILVTTCAVVIEHTAPTSLLAVRRSDMVSALFYYANWHFIAVKQSYFAAQTANSSPLLHTWSLAIEEQFYVVWPLFVVAVMFLGRRRLPVLLGAILGLAAASIARMSFEYDGVDPTRSYFGTDTRAQALLIGAALATTLAAAPFMVRGARANTAARRSGIPLAILIAAALFVLGEKSPIYYRGGAAVFALVVAAALWSIEAAPQQAVGRLLSLRINRWIGGISYGLYLWHWPIIIWLAPRWTHNYRILQALEIGATFAAASASYYLVERPVRRGAVPWVRLSTVRLAVAVGIAGAVVAGVAVATTKPPSGIAYEIKDVSDRPCPRRSRSAGFYYVAAAHDRATWCLRTRNADKSSPVVAAVGDSTARALDPGLRKVAADRGWRYIQAGVAGCSLLRLVVPRTADRIGARQARSCARVVPRLIAQVTAAFHPSVWIVSDLTGHDASDPVGVTAKRRTLLEDSIRSALRRLTAGDAQVVIVAPVSTGQPVECAIKKPPPGYCRRRVFTSRYPLTRFMDLLERQAIRSFDRRVAYIRIDDILCPGGICPAVIDGHLARFDGTHFTGRFSRKIVPIIVERAKSAGVEFDRRDDSP